MAVSQFRVIEAKAVEDRSLEIVHVYFVLHDVETQIVGFADRLPAFDSAARHPHAESQRMMVAAFVAVFPRPADLDHRRAAELAAPDHQRAVQKRSEERRVGKECRSRWSP